MHCRRFLQTLLTGAALISTSLWAAPTSVAPTHATPSGGVSVEDLPALSGDLTLYLGRGEGGLYEKVLQAISDRNPALNLKIRRGPTAALANSIVAEAKAGVLRADVFWAVDSGAIGLVTDAQLAQPLPQDLLEQLKPGFQYPNWAPVTGRVRTLPYNPARVTADKIPRDIMALADSDLSIAWAPAYASFQSFITTMRLLEGEEATAKWLRAVNKRAKNYAGELGVVMAVERGEVDVGFANHYYTLRLKSGKPDADLALAFTNNDAGCLVNASGVLALNDSDTATNFIRYLLSREVQSYLATEAYEIPLIKGIPTPQGLADMNTITPPQIDLTDLADLRPTLKLMRDVGVL